VRLICWDEEDSRRRAQTLKESGIATDATPFAGAGIVAQFRNVSAVCIDLDRLPSHGREVAVALRNTKATRHIPIVFAGGERNKVERIRKELPDAAFTDWPRAGAVLRKTLKKPGAAAEPVRPPAHIERYSGTPLITKLGVAAGMRVALIGAPDGFQDSIEGLVPDNVEFVAKLDAAAKLGLWFVRSRADLERDVDFMAVQLGPGAGLWIVYPKKSGAFRTDLTQNEVRSIGLASGLVDYKVCALDNAWSGLKFARGTQTEPRR